MGAFHSPVKKSLFLTLSIEISKYTKLTFLIIKCVNSLSRSNITDDEINKEVFNPNVIAKTGELEVNGSD